jgi:hypothetical protein
MKNCLIMKEKFHEILFRPLKRWRTGAVLTAPAGCKETVAGLFIVLAMQSCGVYNLSYNGANVSGDMTYTSIELQGSNYMKAYPVDIGVSIGYVNLLRNRYSYYGEDLIPFVGNGISGYSLGLVPVCYFSSGRIQPFLACNFNMILFPSEKNISEDNPDEATIPLGFSMTPNAGVRLFLARKFAFTGSLGYYTGKPGLEQAAIPKKISGMMYSMGLTLTF